MGNTSDSRRGLQSLADNGLRACEYRVVPNVNDLLIEVNILPHQAADFTTPHPCLKGDQAEQICPRAAYRVQKPL